MAGDLGAINQVKGLIVNHQLRSFEWMTIDFFVLLGVIPYLFSVVLYEDM